MDLASKVSPGGRNNDIEEIGIPVLSGRTPQAWEAPDEDIGKDVVLDTSTFQVRQAIYYIITSEESVLLYEFAICRQIKVKASYLLLFPLLLLKV